MSKVPSARLVLLKDLKNCQIEDSVRITGIWTRYDSNSNIAIIQYNDIEVEIDVDQTQEQVSFTDGELVQCLGEITKKTSEAIQVRARIVRSVNALDMELYEKAVELRNKII